jgi:hypothetical protein
MKRDWKKDRAKGAKHARLIAKRPELREALYGSARGSPDKTPTTRETAQQKETP